MARVAVSTLGALTWPSRAGSRADHLAELQEMRISLPTYPLSSPAEIGALHLKSWTLLCHRCEGQGTGGGSWHTGQSVALVAQQM